LPQSAATQTASPDRTTRVPLEFWILLALIAAALTVGAATRLRGKRQRGRQTERNVYPLW
jgi:hypothetical protein